MKTLYDSMGKPYQVINDMKITPHGGCEDNGCIRNYKGCCLIGEAGMVECPEKHHSSASTAKSEGET